METVYRILIVEDMPSDADLTEREVKKVLNPCVFERVETREDFLQKLEDFVPDIIISDYSMPHFDGLTALKLSLVKAPLTPFIVLTGSMNEDTAVECMKSGATNYVIKEHIKRLGAAVLNALEQKNIRIERQKAQEALIESEERYRSIFENNHTIMLLIDPSNGDIVDANPAACTYYGYIREDLKRKRISEISLPAVNKINGKEDSADSFNYDQHLFRHQLANGDIRDVEIFSGPIQVKGKKLTYSIIHDVTERRLAEEQLIKAKEKAEENDRLKTAFLHNISHEIRTPMNAIIGFSAFMNDPDLPNERRKYFLDIICENSNQLLAVITDIINIATIEAGQEKLNERETNANGILDNLLKQFLRKIHDKEISLNFKSRLAEDKTVIFADETKLIEILLNLINNATKFTDKGHVDFGCVIKGDNLEFFVEDTGIGISSEMHAKIFDRFYQVDSTVAKAYSGTGLGLSIAKAYVELMGGKIWLKSELDKGSTFYFTIPYKPVNEVIVKELSKVKEKVNIKSTQTILVAEDEYFNYLLLEELLSENNMKIIRALNGVDAVNICKNNPDIDLILMDIKMPVMDGFEATKEIKQFRPDLPIIAQTAYAHPGDKERALSFGCSDYIAKPFTQQQLLDLIAKFLGNGD
jgi:PAS domain S-box-containing protein